MILPPLEVRFNDFMSAGSILAWDEQGVHQWPNVEWVIKDIKMGKWLMPKELCFSKKNGTIS